jgi:hypothetical protein
MIAGTLFSFLNRAGCVITTSLSFLSWWWSNTICLKNSRSHTLGCSGIAICMLSSGHCIELSSRTGVEETACDWTCSVHLMNFSCIKCIKMSDQVMNKCIMIRLKNATSILYLLLCKFGHFQQIILLNSVAPFLLFINISWIRKHFLSSVIL